MGKTMERRQSGRHGLNRPTPVHYDTAGLADAVSDKHGGASRRTPDI